nr:hypothetical protein [Neobacillus soli]
MEALVVAEASVVAGGLVAAVSVVAAVVAVAAALVLAASVSVSVLAVSVSVLFSCFGVSEKNNSFMIRKCPLHGHVPQEALLFDIIRIYIIGL